MVTFFRHIRKSLLSSGAARKPASPLGRYLLYATGEVLLVMVGILLALQVNNWNEARKSKLLKTDYILKLQDNLENDIVNYNYWLDITKMYESESLYLLDFLEGRTIEVDTIRLKRSLLISQMGTPFPINSAVYKDLVSTGNLKLFKNLEFKNLIETYYSMSTATLPIREADRKALWYDYADLKNKYIDPLLLMKIHRESGAWEFKKPVDLSGYNVKWDEMKSDKEVARMLKLALVHREYIRGSYTTDLKRAKEILLFIQKNNTTSM